MRNENASLESLEKGFSELIQFFRKLSKKNDAGYTGDYGFSSIRDAPNIGLFYNGLSFLITKAEPENTYDLFIEERHKLCYTEISLHDVEQLVLTNVYAERIENKKKEKYMVKKTKSKVKWDEEETPILIRSYDEQLDLYEK